MRGRIAGPVHESVEALRKGTTAACWGGPYRSEELPSLYGRMHFNWTIDYFEAGGNSEWLLPNRLYEGGTFDVVPLALDRTETGRWLAKRKIGIRFDNPETELENFLETLTSQDYLALKSACSQTPRSFFIATQDDCESVAAALQRAADVCAKARPGALYAPA